MTKINISIVDSTDAPRGTVQDARIDIGRVYTLSPCKVIHGHDAETKFVYIGRALHSIHYMFLNLDTMGFVSVNGKYNCRDTGLTVEGVTLVKDEVIE